MNLWILAADANDITNAFPWGVFANYGPLGLFVAWLMWRDGKRDKGDQKIVRSLEGLTQALMVAVLSLKHGDAAIADLARKIKSDSESRSANETSDS